MPYQGELAAKTSHSDIIQNPDVVDFLGHCDFLTPPGPIEALPMVSKFSAPPAFDECSLPDSVMAIDGSYYESSLDERLPSTKIGYVKVGSILILLREFDALRIADGQFVDPFRVARLEDRNAPLAMPLPSANVRWGKSTSVRDSFRAAADAHLTGTRTRFSAEDPYTSLRTTLFHLASTRSGELGTGHPRRLRLHRCPNPSCEATGIELEDTLDSQHCPECRIQVYPADVLRIWEEVSEYQSNASAMTRFMLAVEHMLPVHYMRYLLSISPKALSGLAFFIDGPLAVFGTPAWLHAELLRFLGQTNDELRQRGLSPVVVIGLQKTGQVVDHFDLIDRFLPANRILAIDDDYRYEYVLAGRDPAAKGFGENTYYGQDFMFKTPSSRRFVFALPYPCRSKQEIEDFVNRKVDLSLYPDLPSALRLIVHFESELYENAVVPIALAHRYTAISLVPGGRVLDLLTHRTLEGT